MVMGSSAMSAARIHLRRPRAHIPDDIDEHRDACWRREGARAIESVLAAERFIAEGRTDSDLLGIDETVAIMQTLDDIRALIGVRYPQEG